jgi:hypothetical protein
VVGTTEIVEEIGECELFVSARPRVEVLKG